jgi:hypothetical protein
MRGRNYFRIVAGLKPSFLPEAFEKELRLSRPTTQTISCKMILTVWEETRLMEKAKCGPMQQNDAEDKQTICRLIDTNARC